MARTARYEIIPTQVGYVVIDNLTSMRVRGPFDGATGKKVAAEWCAKLEREAEAKRARGAR